MKRRRAVDTSRGIDTVPEAPMRPRLRRLGAAALAGAVLMVFAALYVTPGNRYITHGIHYAQLSQAPFDFENNTGNLMQFRILTPVLGYVTGLRGDRFFLLVVIVGAVFLAAVYDYFRRRRYGWIEALGMAAMMAFSIPTSLVLHQPGFTDSTSYLLLWLAVMSIHAAWLWPLFWGLALWDHEKNIFAGPWLLALAQLKRFSLHGCALSLLLAAAAVVSVLLFRAHAGAAGAQVEYSAGFYFSAEHIQYTFERTRGTLMLGIFGAFRLFWIWPLYAIYRLWRIPERRRMAGWLALVIGMAALQLVFGHDITRLMGLAFVAVLLGAHEVRRLWGSAVFVRRLWLLIGLNFLLPNYMVYWTHIAPFYNLPVFLLYLWGFDYNPWMDWV